MERQFAGLIIRTAPAVHLVLSTDPHLQHAAASGQQLALQPGGLIFFPKQAQAFAIVVFFICGRFLDRGVGAQADDKTWSADSFKSKVLTAGLSGTS